MMSIGNQKFGIPRKYQYQIGIWYFCPKFLGIFLVFYRQFENDNVKIWLNFGIFFGKIKIGLVFGFCGCHFIGIGLVMVCHFLKMRSLVHTHLTSIHPWVIPCEITQKSAILTPTPFDFGENW